MVAYVQAHPPQNLILGREGSHGDWRVDMCWDCVGVGRSCRTGACERGEEESTGFLLTGCGGAWAHTTLLDLLLCCEQWEHGHWDRTWRFMCGVGWSCWLGSRGVDPLHSQLHCARDEKKMMKCSFRVLRGNKIAAPGVGILFPGWLFLLWSPWSSWDFFFFQEIC